VLSNGQSGTNPHVPVIALSGQVRDSDMGATGSPSKETAKEMARPRDDLKTFLGEFVAGMSQFELPAELILYVVRNPSGTVQ
jgi:hypothetical protein